MSKREKTIPDPLLRRLCVFHGYAIEWEKAHRRWKHAVKGDVCDPKVEAVYCSRADVEQWAREQMRTLSPELLAVALWNRGMTSIDGPRPKYQWKTVSPERLEAARRIVDRMSPGRGAAK